MRGPLELASESRLVRLVNLLGRPPRGRMKRIFLFGALILFIAGSIVAATQLDVRLGDLNWAYLVLISALALPTLIASAAEYRVSGLIAGRTVAFTEALRVSLYASAANMLPLPAGAAVRVQSLRSEGARTGAALAATAVMAFAWLGLALIAAGSFLFADRPSLAAGSLIVGGLALAGAGLGLRRLAPPDGWRRLAASALLVEVVFVLNASLRTFLALRALGFEVGATEAVVLALSSALSAFAGIFPSGLGIRELISAGLAPVVGLQAAAGFAVAALLRVLTTAVFALAAFVAVAGSPGNAKT